MALLSVTNLSVSTRADEVIVHPISFELFAGEPLTIVGETGSGKTLLAQAIAHTLPDDLTASGQIRLLGQSLDALNSEERRALWGKAFCILPQEPMRALDPTMKSAQQVRESYRLTQGLSVQSANQRTMEDFKNAQLHHALNQYPFELSGGMAQRVAFLSARAGGATFTLADEPTKGLDANKRDQLTQQLSQSLENNEGVLTITHDIDVAHQLGGRVMIMKDGTVIEQGQTKEVLSHPKQPYTQTLINADPRRWAKQASKQQDTAPCLQVRELQKNRGSRSLFQNLSFSLNKGDVLGVSGESGCGKSTLGDVVLGLLPPDNGEVVWAEKTHTAKRAQKLFQDPSDVFSAHVTLETSFDDVMKKHNIARDALPRWLNALKLDAQLLERYPDQVSGGELQRLAIARVMLLEPEFIFADEPTSRLDMLTQKTVIDALLHTVKEHKVALMLVSHDTALLDNVCDEVIYL